MTKAILIRQIYVPEMITSGDERATNDADELRSIDALIPCCFCCSKMKLPMAFVPNESGQVYRCRALKYQWAPDVYLAFVWR